MSLLLDLFHPFSKPSSLFSTIPPAMEHWSSTRRRRCTLFGLGLMISVGASPWSLVSHKLNMILFLGLSTLLTGSDPAVSIVDVSECMVNFVKDVYEHGGRNFLFQNVGDLVMIMCRKCSQLADYPTATLASIRSRLLPDEILVLGKKHHRLERCMLPLCLTENLVDNILGYSRASSQWQQAGRTSAQGPSSIST